MKAFNETTIFLFSYLIQQLWDVARVLPILEVDQWIKVTCIEAISLINSVLNFILAHRPQPPSTSSLAHVEGNFILTKSIERLNVTINSKISEKRYDPMTTIVKEGAMSTSALALVFTLDLARASILPLV